MTTSTMPSRMRWHRRGPIRLAEMIAKSLAAVARSIELRRQRMHLASLDDRMLRDMGLSRADVEYSKPMWRP